MECWSIGVWGFFHYSITPILQYSNEQHEDKTITIVEDIRKITLNLD
jgi:hypothetical protein